MKRMFGGAGKPSPAMILSVIAVVLALTGTAIAGLPKSGLKLGNFNQDSRDRLAGTGVIQYAAAQFNTGTSASFDEIKTYTVKCELSKKATAGGFKWSGPTPPTNADYELLDAYPNGSGFVVRLYIDPAGTAENQQLTVYANCVKSRAQRGTPPA